jgi:hypothetical protein
MEPEGSSPYTQELTICPYSEPDQSSLRPPTQPLEDPPHHKKWIMLRNITRMKM